MSLDVLGDWDESEQPTTLELHGIYWVGVVQSKAIRTSRSL